MNSYLEELPTLDPDALDHALLEDPHDAASHEEALAELRETLLAWQRGKAAIEATAGQPSPARRHLYRAQSALLESLSPEARAILVESRGVVVDSMIFSCVDIDGDLLMDSWPVLVLS